MRMSDHGYYLKSYLEMERLFGEVPGALSNSLLIAEMCDVNPEPGGYHLPNFDVPEGYTADSYLRHLCEKGLVWRYGAERAADDERLRRRLEHELKHHPDDGLCHLLPHRLGPVRVRARA
jgi:DNA polymerase III subunit alpha